MKKVLLASTALAAAGMMMSAAPAAASEKITLGLGGFSKWWVVGQWQQDSYQNASAQDFNSVDIKGDNEIYFGGSTTLDNGMKVGIQVEFEAGGHTDQTSDPVDESYVWIETGFGKMIVGSENNGTYLLHVMAPDAAGNWGEAGMMTGGFAIARPALVRGITPNQNANNNNTTAIITDGDADKITYVSPTFAGLTLAASYAPNGVEDDRGLTSLGTVGRIGEVYGAGALYANTFAGAGFKLSAGWATYDMATSGGTGQDTDIDEYSAGVNVTYAGFTLGGSYRQVVAGDGIATSPALNVDFDGEAWDAGVQYATGPYAVSLSYFRSKVGGTVTTAGDDEIQLWQASGKYNLGAGVDVLASLGWAKFDDETTSSSNNNEGWTVMTGLGLSF